MEAKRDNTNLGHENRTILIVDDEPETVKGYVDFLTPKNNVPVRKSSRQPFGTGPDKTPALENYRLLTASSGEEAIKTVESEMKQGRRVAAGFFDVKLEGGMDGLATIHAIKALDKDIHCVVVTAYHDRSVDEINQLFGEEFKDQWDYLNKPFTEGEIIQKARQMIAAWNRKIEVRILHAQLIRSERLAGIGQVARGVGHEFGNILLRIMGKTDLALMENDVGKIHDHLKVLMSAAERAGVIVRNLQSFSRAEPQLKVSPLSSPIEEALSLVNHELMKCSVQVTKNFTEIPPVRIDPATLGQVFLNLFVNAMHAMPKGGALKIVVDVGTAPSGKKSAYAKVIDSGTGITPETLPRVFEFAFTTKGDRGSGLGLAISKEIVEAHGGQITVTTEVGKGTEFTVWIPVTTAGGGNG